MEGFMGNVRLALRHFRRAPGFTFVAAGTIALGIGANVAIFSVVNTVLLDPLPYDSADELVAIWEWHELRDRQKNVANPGNFSAWRDGSESFAQMTSVSMAMPATVTAAAEPEEAMVQYASPDFFEVLGLEASLGRTLASEAEVVISDRYWRERFAASPTVVGQTVELNGLSVVIVGVLPRSYVVFGEGTDLWAANANDEGDQTNSGRWLMVVGRLAPGATLSVAEQELKAIAVGLQEAFPVFNAGWTVQLVPLKDEIVGDVQQALWILLGAVGLLLVIACANVANLFLVRATDRQREMAVRTSLGATGGSLAGQLLTESLLLAGGGASLGVAIAHVTTRWMSTSMPDAFALPRVEGAGVDPTVLAFAVVMTVGTALVFGLLPAVQAARTSPAGTLGAEARGPSRFTGVVRNGLVIAEVSVSVVLLSGAALLGRSFSALMAVDHGIEAEHVLVGRVNLAGSKYPTAAPKVAFFDELFERIAAKPGVEAVGGVTFLPMDGQGAANSYWVADRAAPDPADRRAADIRNVAGNYFDAMGISLLRGRLFDDRDRTDAPQTVVVNRSLADMYWPGETAVGRQVVVDWVDETPWEIIGVVEDVRNTGPETEARETIYIHYAKGTFFPWMHVAVRATGDPALLMETVRLELAGLDETLAMGSVRVMEELVNRAVARPRLTSLFMLIFAGLATVLAAVGMYGVLSYAVSRRVREIGVRIALGSEPGRVLGMIVAQGARLTAVGLALGLGAATLANRLIAGLLYEIAPSDPVALFGAGGVLAAVELLACAIPAWRASRVEPAEALRAD